MKRIILVALVFWGCNKTSAQDINFGLKGGLNFCTLVGSDQSKLFLGANLGGYIEIKESNKFSFQPELLVSIQGARTDGYTRKLKYVYIPLMTKYKITEKINIQAGPQIGFLTSVKYNNYEVKERYNSIDFGVNLGVGYELSENMFLEARYCNGLIPTKKEKDLDPGESETKNAVVQLSVGYRF